MQSDASFDNTAGLRLPSKLVPTNVRVIFELVLLFLHASFCTLWIIAGKAELGGGRGGVNRTANDDLSVTGLHYKTVCDCGDCA